MSINIVIGTEPRTEIARKVLEFSILKHTKSNINFHNLMGEDYVDRGDLNQGTGFSLLRFKIPEDFNYQDRAIYLDADMLLLSDINELWNIKTNNAVGCKFGNQKANLAETSMMLIDNQLCKDKIKTQAEIKKILTHDNDLKKYRALMRLEYLSPQPFHINKWWNVMDKSCVFCTSDDFFSKKAKLLHYSNVRIQPWFNPEHFAASIWEKYFKLAYQSGYVSKDEIFIAKNKFDLSNSRRPNGIHEYWYNKIL